MTPSSHRSTLFAVPALALFLILPIVGLSDARAQQVDRVYRLSQIVDPNQVMYVLTNDPESRRLGLSAAEWEHFARGPNSLFRQAFDPGRTVSTELLPGFAVLLGIDAIEDIPEGRMKEANDPWSAEYREFVQNQQVWFDRIGYLISGISLQDIYGKLVEGIESLASSWEQYAANRVYSVYREARENAPRGTGHRHGLRAVEEDRSLVAEVREVRASLATIMESYGRDVSAARIDAAFARYLRRRYELRGRQAFGIADAIEEIIRADLAVLEQGVLERLRWLVRRRLDSSKPCEYWPGDERQLVQALEYDKMGPHKAIAIGQTSHGCLAWGRSWGQSNRDEAVRSALTSCRQYSTTSCRVVVATRDRVETRRVDATIERGTYSCSGGFSRIEITEAGSGYAAGTYISTYDKSAKGRIRFQRRNGGWTGSWGEPAVGRSGELHQLTVSEGGFSGEWVVTTRGNYRGRDLPKNRGPFSCR